MAEHSFQQCPKIGNFYYYRDLIVHLEAHNLLFLLQFLFFASSVVFFLFIYYFTSFLHQNKNDWKKNGLNST